MRFQAFRKLRESRRLRGGLTGVALLSAVLLVGCGGGEAPPDTFIFARGTDASKLDPADVDDGESVNTIAQMFEPLVQFAPGSLAIVPCLASRWTVSDDGLVYTFTIRDGVTFHDGTPLNAETAAWSFHRQMDPEHPAHFDDASFQYWSYLYKDITSVTATGPMTLEIRLGEPNASILASLASFPAYLISPGAFATYGAELPRHPVGTGPYRFVDWKPNEAVIMEANPDYWDTANPPRFDRLVMRTIPDNTVRLLALKSGEVHGLDGLQPAELAELKDDPQFVVYHEPGMNVGYLSFSHFAERLRDPEVRRAIAMAINREAMVELVLDGYGVPADYPMPPGFLGIPANGEAPFTYDPEAARDILAAHPELTARPLELAAFNAPRPYFPDPLKVASLLRSDLEAVGLKVEITTRDFKSHLHTTRNGDFEMAILGWNGDNGDPDNFLATFFASWAAVKGAATNISFYADDRMDALLTAGRQTTDPAQRQQIYERALAIWARDLPLIPLVHAEQITVLRREIDGYQLHPTTTHYFHSVGWAPDGGTP